MQLPLNGRIEISYAFYYYIPEKTNVRPIGDKIIQSLLGALKEGSLTALGQYNYRGKKEDDRKIPPVTWKRYNSTSFKTYAILDQFVREDISDPDGPFYLNPMLTISDIDAWLAPSLPKEAHDINTDSISQDTTPIVKKNTPEAIIKKNYMKRVESILLNHQRSSRAEDDAWAVQNGYPTTIVRAFRNELAPTDWKEKGRRPKLKICRII